MKFAVVEAVVAVAVVVAAAAEVVEVDYDIFDLRMY